MIEPATIWILIVGLGIATYAIRFSFLGLLGGRAVPDRVRRILAFVPATVLPALIAPMVLTDNSGALSVEPDVGIAALTALVMAYAFRSNVAGIASGSAAFFAVSLLL